MIHGEVTPDDEAVITITIRNSEGVDAHVRAAVDTGFTDYLTLPPDLIATLNLPFLNTIRLYLAGNAEAVFDMHAVTILWDGEPREILAYKADGEPLIGMSMLRGYMLSVEAIDGGLVTIERL